MVDPIAAHRLGYRLLYLAIAALVLFVRILPLGALPVRIPTPDIVLCCTIVWVLRRPDYVPAVLIAVVFLVEDILIMRPPGLWPAIVLLATEFLRSREVTLRDVPFAVEWMIAGALISAMTVFDRLVLAAFLVPGTAPWLTVLHILTTVLAYPVVAVLTHFVFGLRKAAPGQVDALGHRL